MSHAMEVGLSDYGKVRASVHRLGACSMDDLLVIFDKRNSRALYELINDGCDINAIYRRFEKAQSPVRTTHTCLLQMAIERKWMTGVNMLINAGACVEGPTFLGDAGSWGRHQYRNPTRTPLMVAAEVGDVDALQLLIDAGGDVNAMDDVTGDTALRLAIVSQSTACVMLLIQMGAWVNAIGKPYAAMSTDGQAFHMPIIALTGVIRNFKKADDKIRESSSNECHTKDDIHTHDSDFDAEECYKKTLWLHIIEMLIERGANINFDGLSTECSPLVESLECGDTSVLELLLQHNALVNKETHVVLWYDPVVNSALGLALYLNNIRGLRLLLEHGARVNDLPISLVEYGIRQGSYLCLYSCLQAGYSIQPSTVQLLRKIMTSQSPDVDVTTFTTNDNSSDRGGYRSPSDIEDKTHNDYILREIMSFIQEPKPLQWLSRDSIRNAMRQDIAETISKLAVPKTLQDYLLFRKL